jgi:predicted nuclease with TOPRIM domain
VYLHQKVLTAKQEIQRSKNEAVNESMMFLKRRVAELERTNNELGNQNSVINNKLKASLSEKEQMKLQISQLRNQVKLLNEMSSDLTMKNAIHAQILPQGMTKGAHDSGKGAGGRAQTL